jgi:multimeric flavodoxin WrbA
MKVLGVSAGAADGSAEILLKAALMQAEALGHEVALVRLDDLSIPAGPFVTDEPDDGPWFWERVMDADAIIYSTPIYSRTIPGKLRLLTDRVFGPNADVGFVELLLERERAGEPVMVPFRPDERVLKSRVVGFIAVGGALTDNWGTLALPLMHSLAFSMRAGVVDQVCFRGAGVPAAILLQPEAVQRARKLGAEVAAQLGRAYEQVQYCGDPGLCPVCHLDVIAVRGDVVECASCGALGHFQVTDGRVGVVFPPEGVAKSVFDLGEKRAHSLQILETAAQQAALAPQFAAEAASYAGWDRRIVPAREEAPAPGVL